MPDEAKAVGLLAERAQRSFEIWRQAEPAARARVLRGAAQGLTHHAGALIALADTETRLGAARLTGELKRTVVQLGMFAEIAEQGRFLTVQVDEEDPSFALGVRPDIRRTLSPLGVALNFSAGNFPFAFSVAGGDTASAIAAGCPVIVKVHPGHPRLSEAVASAIGPEMSRAGAPGYLVQLVHEEEVARGILVDSRIKVATFTGSHAVGLKLARLAAERDMPIPFYGELGSVNPVVVSGRALHERPSEIASGFVASVAGSAGQLCTKPGFVFVPAAMGFDERASGLLSEVPEQRMLTPGIAARYAQRRTTLMGCPELQVVSPGGVRFDPEGEGWVRPTILKTHLSELAKGRRPELLEEAFGPLAILVEYDDEGSLAPAIEGLFGGVLAAALHIGQGEAATWIPALVTTFAGLAGRVVFDGWPTGVAVTPAMQHGGPWPATTSDTSTAIGGHAIERFLRPVAYQNAPEGLLPPPLREANPWGVPHLRHPADASASWLGAWQAPPR
jgi:NADP-dependent aldehyde dehydrogenase